jgi:hypothetical protein
MILVEYSVYNEIPEVFIDKVFASFTSSLGNQ